MNSFLNISLLIICYKPKDEDVTKIKRNCTLFSSGIIVWNSQKRFSLDNPNFSEIQMDHNVGQATALNIGFKKASSMNINLLLTLDQDSELFRNEKQILEKINNVTNICINPGGFFFPSLVSKPSFELNNSKYLEDPIEYLTPITSGCCYILPVWKDCGGFKDDLFIEGVDTEYSLRLRRYGYKFYKFNFPIIVHDAGELIYRKLIFFSFKIRRHSDIRIFLQYRNNLPLFCKYFLYHPKWASTSIFNVLTKKIILSLLGSKNIFRTLTYIIKGILVGILSLFIDDNYFSKPEVLLNRLNKIN